MSISITRSRLVGGHAGLSIPYDSDEPILINGSIVSGGVYGIERRDELDPTAVPQREPLARRSSGRTYAFPPLASVK
jgi:hypothetical protein